MVKFFSLIQVFASDEFTRQNLDVDNTESAWKLSKEHD